MNRLLRLLLIGCLSSMSLWACDDSDSPSDETMSGTTSEGGASGESGEGGEAAEGGESGAGGEAGEGGDSGASGQGGSMLMGPNCGNLTLVDLNALGTADGDGFVFEGNTTGRNDYQGSCEAQTEGADLAIRFQFPTAGTWEFDTESSAHDTVLYVRSDCIDAAAELACNDDINYEAGLTQSRVQVEGAEGDYVFVIVDAYDDMNAQLFTLRARPFVPTNPPAVDEVEVFLNTSASQIGVRVSGSDEEKDVVSLALNLYNLDGAGLFADAGDVDVFAFDDVQYLEDSSRFVATKTINIDGDLSLVTSATGGAVDEQGNLSNLREATLGSPTLVERDAICDDVEFVCDETSACVNGLCVNPTDFAECPEDWMVTDITLENEGPTVIRGDNSMASGLRRGSCGGGGATVIYRLISDETLALRATTGANETAADTVLFARRLCDLDGSILGQDLACNDDISFVENGSDDNNYMSQIIFNVPANEPVFIFVDSFTGTMGASWTGNFTLTLEGVESATLASATATIASDGLKLGVKVAGQHEGNTLTGGKVTISGLGMEPFEVPVEGSFEVDGDSFTGILYVDLPDNTDPQSITLVSVAVVDELERTTNAVTATLEEVANVASGGGCDLAGVFDVCAVAEEACYELIAQISDSVAATEEANGAICQVATKPVIDAAEFISGDRDGAAGFSLAMTITDPEQDVLGLTLILQGLDDLPLFPEETPATTEIGTQYFENGELRFQEFLQVTDDVMVNELGSIVITVTDSAGLQSESFIAMPGTPTVLAENDACEVGDFSAICADGLLCVESACTQLARGCGDFPVVNLNENASDNGWVYAGDTTNASNLNPNCDLAQADRLVTTDLAAYFTYLETNCSFGTCGGGGSNEAISFTADEAGSYTCRVEADGEDPLLYARSFCSSNLPAAELACNDDIDNATANSQISLSLNIGQQIFLLVDGYGGIFQSPYTLTCERD